MEAWLAVEQYDVSVSKMSFDDEPGLDGFCDHFSVGYEFETNSSSIGPHNIECSWIIVRAVIDEPFHLFDIVTGNFVGNCQPARNIQRDSNFVNVEVRIRGHDCPG